MDTRPTHWDPTQYQRHRGHRVRPLHDLLARVPPLPTAARVADLGCGPGGPSALLADRWPTAHITGYDNSPDMLDQARHLAGPSAGGGSLGFAHADLVHWRPSKPHDLMISNAALQWVPGHPALLQEWKRALAPGGTLAFQVPGNFAAPSHQLLRELCDSPAWRHRLSGTLRDAEPTLPPAGYLHLLSGPGWTLDVWETTYLHVLPGEDPVLDWTKGTALRPVLTALQDDPSARAAFLAQYRDALRAAYPATEDGTVLPFRRIFAVAHRAQEARAT